MHIKQIIIFTFFVFLLLAGFNVEGRLAVGGANYVIPPNSVRCESIVLPDDFPVTQGAIQYTITSDCGEWCDLSEARVDAAGANSVTIPFCMNAFDKQLGNSKKFTITLGYPGKESTFNYGICVANQGGTSTGTGETTNPCAAVNSFNIFKLDVESPITVQKDVEKEYSIMIHSTEKAKIDLTVDGKKSVIEVDPALGQITTINAKTTASTYRTFKVIAKILAFYKKGQYVDCNIDGCTQEQKVIVNVDKGSTPTPSPKLSPSPKQSPSPSPKVSPSKDSPSPGTSPDVVVQSPSPGASPNVNIQSPTPTPSPDAEIVVQPGQKGFATSLFPDSVSVKKGQEAQFLLEVENYDSFEKQFEITIDLPEKLKSSFDKITKKIGPASKGSTTISITPEGADCIYLFSVTVANSGSTKNMQGSIQVNEAACDMTRSRDTANLTDDQQNVINQGIISTRNSTKSEDIKTIENVIRKVNPPQPITTTGPDGEVIEIIPLQTTLQLPAPPSGDEPGQIIDLPPGGGETDTPVIGPGQPGKSPKPTKSPDGKGKIFGIDITTFIIIVIVAVVAVLLVLMLKRGKSKKSPWDKDWESERNWS